MAQVAILERRVLLSSTAGVIDEAPLPASSAGLYADPAPSSATGQSDPVATNSPTQPLTAVPILHSYPQARVKIYLDFAGAAAQSWGGYSVPATPAYDQDGDPTTFTDGELASIQEIWARVAEKFSPFNVDVTTENPGGFAAHQAMDEIIGGDGSWIDSEWGGATYIGGFASGNTTSWVFSQNLTNGDPHNVAEATAHEIGHAFGLQHQSDWENGLLVDQYNNGNALTAPIMGRDYAATRGVWWDGADLLGPSDMQDDMSIIGSPNNGFGYRPEDHGQTIATADAMTAVNGTSLSASGVIESTGDTDMFAFTTGAGTVQFQVNVAQYGPTLDAKLVLLDSNGSVVETADTATLGESMSLNVPAGSYYIEVASHGSYGDVGQYTLSGSILPPPVQAAPPTSTSTGTGSSTGQGSTTGGSSTTSGSTSTSITTPTLTIVHLPPLVTADASDELSLDLTATLVGKHNVRLNWDVPTTIDRKARVVVQRSLDGGQTWINAGRLGRRAHRFTDGKAVAGQTVSYRIAVLDGTDVSYSEVLSVQLPAIVKHARAKRA
jgi:hypothetical protein